MPPNAHISSGRRFRHESVKDRRLPSRGTRGLNNVSGRHGLASRGRSMLFMRSFLIHVANGAMTSPLSCFDQAPELCKNFDILGVNIFSSLRTSKAHDSLPKIFSNSWNSIKMAEATRLMYSLQNRMDLGDRESSRSTRLTSRPRTMASLPSCNFRNGSACTAVFER